jgi:uncharacterized Ntn-hydrolase superfamily protein
VLIATFSIAANDREAEEWGVAVASKFLAVGAVVPWARAKIGAVATQALANVSYGPRGLELLESKRSAREALDELVSSDEMAEHRQAGIVDFDGKAATYTGESCLPWAGGVAGEGFAVQGNILTGPEVVESMKDSFLSATGALADRMLDALMAGDRAGGDSRGRQSAALLLVREGGGYGGGTDKTVDLRVDDHSDPVVELRRLRRIHRLYLEAPRPSDLLDIDAALGAEIGDILVGLGALEGPRPFDHETSAALRSVMSMENLEMRWAEGKIDRTVLQYLRDKASSGD